jgi:regulator of replication initiation timing
MNQRLFVTVILVFGAVCGCQEESQVSLWDQIKQLGQEKVTLREQNEKLQSENEELKKQVRTLSAIDPQVRAEAVAAMKKIEIGKRSGLFDKDSDGIKEKLIVYVRPSDETGDTVKTPGSVEVQLWDLNNESGQAMLASWQLGPEDIKTLWASTLMTNYYRLTFDVSGILDGTNQELTVKVRFTDYMTGKSLTAQKVINSN